MARLNKKPESIHTHGGGIAQAINPELQLRRSVLATMLWEKGFYEEGIEIAERISDLCNKVKDETVAKIAIEARNKQHLRHVPLLLALGLIQKKSKLAKDVIAEIIQRPDELTEFLSMYWRNGKTPIAAQMKKGLAKAFTKFNEYQLAKYNRADAIKLRDVLFLCHAKPKDKEQADLWEKLVKGELAVPDTWEVALSSGSNKKESWTRLISEKKLGGLATIRNIRNMMEAKVDRQIIKDAIANMNTDKILPFRFLSAAKHAPDFEPELEGAMFKNTMNSAKLPGKTILIVDVSGSMYHARLSSKSELDRAEAACSLAVLIRELCEDPCIYATAGNDRTRIHQTAKVPPRRGFALKDAIYKMCHPLGGGGIFLNQVMTYVKEKETEADRIIVITDEQDCSGSSDSPLKAPTFGENNYMINVASNKNGIGYGKWIHIDGFSESILDYIMEYEGLARQGNLQ